QYLQGATQDRRDLLRAQFKHDRDFASNGKTDEVENGWEKVSTPPGQKPNDGWDGIVGFFHPFWWVSAKSISERD
ncbi:asparagine-linked glycosylation protein, partial [Elasticomyces elasticus]